MTVISQPRYLPALTYLQRLHFAETFVLLDNVQRQKRGFENRNRVLVNASPKWLTIPSKSSSRALIQDTIIDGSEWITNHKKKLDEYYNEAPFYDPSLIDLYYGDLEDQIALMDYDFTESLAYLIKNICRMLNFEPVLLRASQLNSKEVEEAEGPDKIFEIAKQTETDLYISGINGREYGILECFEQSSIGVKFHTDQPTPYSQAGYDFVPHLAFFDALFYAGKDWVENQVKKIPTLED